MFSSSGDEESTNQPNINQNLNFKRLIAQQDEMQKDLAKLADLMKKSNIKRRPSSEGRYKQLFSEAINEPVPNVKKVKETKEAESMVTLMEKPKGKGCLRTQEHNGTQQVRFKEPTISIANNSSTERSSEKRFLMLNNNTSTLCKYIRVQADCETGEPVILIYDEVGQSQVACAYLSKDFKLDIDFKLWELNNKKVPKEDICGSRYERNSFFKTSLKDARQSTSPRAESPCAAVDMITPSAGCSNWYIWRIDNYANVEERNCGEWSEAFYLGQPGYRMQAKLEFTTYIFGAYIRLVCGEYDGCLMWPFDNDIFFSILDQTGSCNHIVRVLRPYLCDSDEKGLWDRPCAGSSECQIGWGLPDLCLRSLIHSTICKPSPYMRNGTLYIQISLGKAPQSNDVC